MGSLGMGPGDRAADIAAIQEAKRAMEASRIALNTPPLERNNNGVRTPPHGTAMKRSSADLDRDDVGPKSRGHARNASRSSRQLDPTDLRNALNREFGESSGNGARYGSGGTTPAGSPSRKRQRVYGDR